MYCVPSPEKPFVAEPHNSIDETKKTLSSVVIISEILFLGILPFILNDNVTISLLIISTISIAVLAPYNHPNIDLSDEESTACAKSAKKRLIILILLLIILYVMQLEQLATGILLGIVMAAVTLVLAYILKGEK